VNDTFGSLKGLLATARATLFNRYDDPDDDIDSAPPAPKTGKLVNITNGNL
jgi:hypothetical protein